MVFFGKESDDLFKSAHVPNADVEEKVGFYHIDDETCAKQFGAQQPGSVFFRQFETK